MFPITFNAFGDIVAAANLAVTIYNALRDSQGAAYEYQLLIDELDSLAKVLKISNDRAVTATASNPLIADGLLQEARRCLALLDRFHEGIQKYQNASSKGGKGSSWRKIGWALFKEKDVANLRMKLAGHRENLVLYMQTATAQMASQSNRNSTALQHEVTHVKTVTAEILSILKSIPAQMHTGPGNGIYLIDLLGQQIIVPMLVCSTWEGMEGYIKLIATNRLGQSFVDRGDFELIGDAGADVLRPADWGKTVRPGMAVEMAAIVRQSLPKSLQFKCHRCQRESDHNASASIECLRCDAHSRFQWSELQTHKPVEFWATNESHVQLIRRVHYQYLVDTPFPSPQGPFTENEFTKVVIMVLDAEKPSLRLAVVACGCELDQVMAVVGDSPYIDNEDKANDDVQRFRCET